MFFIIRVNESETSLGDIDSLVFEYGNQASNQPNTIQMSLHSQLSVQTESLDEETTNPPTVISNHIRKKALEFSERTKSDSLISPVLNNRAQNSGKRNSPVRLFLLDNYYLF